MFALRWPAAVLLATILASCVPSVATPTPTPAAKPNAVIHFGYSPSGSANAPLFLADALGYLDEQGISIDFVSFPSSSDVIPAATRGDIDAATAGINPAVLNALAGNFGLKIVSDSSTQFPGYPLNVMVVTNEMANTIKGPADLKGRKIGLTPPGMGTASGLMLSGYLAQANLTPNDVDVVPLTFQDQVAALTNRSIDAALMAEPYATQVVNKSIATVLMTTDTVMPNYEAAVMLFTNRFMSANHDVGVRFMTGYLRGMRAYMGAFGRNAVDREHIIQILTQRTDIKDPQLWAEMTPTGGSPDGTMNVQSIGVAQAYFSKLGLVTNTPAPETLVDRSFTEAAVKTLGPGQPPVPPR